VALSNTPKFNSLFVFFKKDPLTKVNGFIFYRKHLKYFLNFFKELITRVFGFGFYYLRGLAFIFFIDACLTDDEPLWEPIE
jgi:hypothetical protein